MLTGRPNMPADTGLKPNQSGDRKSTRLNSSHLVISYAVFCLKKKKHIESAAHRLVVRPRVTGALRHPEMLDFRQLPREQLPRAHAGRALPHHRPRARARTLTT